jgi:hypothetical protein
MKEFEGNKTSIDAISYDSLPYSYISTLHHRFGEKVFNPNLQDDATEKLLKLREKWHKQGSIAVFSSGVFDMLHMDHMAYLLHVKATGAALHYEQQEYQKPWNELTTEKQQEYTNRALGARAIKLIISVDGDKSVTARKGNDPKKNGAPAPIYGWETRAMMVASQSFISPDDDSGDILIPTVDAITIHGPQDFSDDNVHSSHFNLVSQLQPDIWTVFGESKDILEGVPLRPELDAVAIRCIQDGVGIHYFEDAFIGKMSTTSISNRIKGIQK